MGDEGHASSGVTSAEPAAPVVAQHHGHAHGQTTMDTEERMKEEEHTPMSPRNFKNPYSRAQTSVDVTDYFVGPRDTAKHSKWPVFMQMHGSILPEMILPLTFVCCWATALTVISQRVHSLGVNQLLLTVLGFVVALGLSFRSSTAYERYAEGRRYWAQLVLTSHNMARLIWIHGIERPGYEKEDLLAKVTGLNLIVAFSVALKHKLRFEPYTAYDDLAGLVGHLDTFARDATQPDTQINRRKSSAKKVGEYLGVSFAESNPRKLIKKSDRPLGNLPLEILNHLAAFLDNMVQKEQLKIPMHQTVGYNNIAAMNDVLTGTDRILNTPLPVAYSIAIAQITWVYIIVLPFQLVKPLEWLAIPASVIAAYIILGFLLIGREIENPFGEDVNDLPLDDFCRQIAADIDVISSRKKPAVADFTTSSDNVLMFPLSNSGYPQWATRSERVIRDELMLKTQIGFQARKDAQDNASHRHRKSAERKSAEQKSAEQSV